MLCAYEPYSSDFASRYYIYILSRGNYIVFHFRTSIEQNTYILGITHFKSVHTFGLSIIDKSTYHIKECVWTLSAANVLERRCSHTSIYPFISQTPLTHSIADIQKHSLFSIIHWASSPAFIAPLLYVVCRSSRLKGSWPTHFIWLLGLARLKIIANCIAALQPPTPGGWEIYATHVTPLRVVYGCMLRSILLLVCLLRMPNCLQGSVSNTLTHAHTNTPFTYNTTSYCTNIWLDLII